MFLKLYIKCPHKHHIAYHLEFLRDWQLAVLSCYYPIFVKGHPIVIVRSIMSYNPVLATN